MGKNIGFKNINLFLFVLIRNLSYLLYNKKVFFASVFKLVRNYTVDVQVFTSAREKMEL